VAYPGTGGVGSLRIGEVSGTSITYGSEFTYEPLTGIQIVNMLDTSTFVFTYSTASGVFSRVGSLSGTTITSLNTKVLVSGINLDPDKVKNLFDTQLLDSSRFIIATQFNEGDTPSTHEGRAIIGSISGTTISFPSPAIIYAPVINSNPGGGAAAIISISLLDTDNGAIIYKKGPGGEDVGSPLSVLFSTSGTIITVGTPSLSLAIDMNTVDSIRLDNTRVATIIGQDVASSLPPLLTYIGELFEFISLSSSNSNYPKPIGNKNIATFFWSQNPTKNNAQVRIERGYNITFTSGSIELGGTTAIWNSSGIQSIMSILNDGGEHSLATFLEYQSGTTWKLFTSVDGEPFVDRGVQDVGSQGLLTTSTDAEVFLFDPDDEDQWLDEAVLWAGEPEQFNQFTDLELFKLNRLATILDQPMPSFSTAAFPVSASGNLVIPTTFNVSQLSGTLFIIGHTPVESSVALVAKGPVPVSGSNALVLQGPAGRSMNLVTKGPIPESGNTTLFIKGPLPLQSSGTLFIEGVEILNANIDLVIPITNEILQSSEILFIQGGGLIDNNITLITKGPIVTTSQISLFMQGHSVVQTSGDLVVPNPFDVLQSSGILFTNGITSSESGLNLFIEGVSVEAVFDKIVDVFLRTADFNPTVIGLFTPSTSGVTIEVFDVIDGVNTQLTLLDDICFAIGDTGRFGWSTENLPAANRNSGQLVFRMTDSIGEIFVGEFFLTNPGDGSSSHPGDFDDYILKG